MALTKVTSGGIADIAAAVEGASDSNKFTDADHSKLNGIAASANNYTHPNHSGEVTSTADGATVIADNVVDEANLKVSNSPTNGYALTAQSGNTGGLTWAAMSGGATSLNGLSDATTSDTNNIGIGDGAVDSITTGDYNTGVGSEAMTATTTGSKNTALGRNALGSNTEGSFNVAVGRNAGWSNTTSNNNVSVGDSALYSNTTGTENVAVGTEALKTNVTGIENTAVGHKALTTNTGDQNVAVGREALKANTSGGNNVAVGYLAMLDNTTGNQNVAVGQQALKVNTEGLYNVAVGSQALKANTTQDYNTAVGYRAGVSCTTGVGENTMIGREAGEDCSTGEGNTLIGNLAGQNKTGSGSTCVGNKAGMGNTGENNCFIARSNGGPNHSTVWLYGASSGACYQGNNSSSWTTSSDERIKKDIVDSPNGLAKIDALKVRNFKYRTQSEITVEGLTECDAPGLQTGVIAQEVETILPEAVSTRETGTKEVSTDPIFWAMVKAVQELSAKNDALEARITTLEGQE